MNKNKIWLKVMYVFIGVLIVLSSLLTFIIQENAIKNDDIDTLYQLAQFNPLFSTITFFFKLTPQYHSEMWNYSVSITGWTFPIDASDIYYNLTGLVEGKINGFNFTNETQENGGTYLTALHPGIYNVQYSMSFSSGAKVLYGFAAVKNFEIDDTRSCYSRGGISSTGVVGNIAGSCIMDIEFGDKINLQIDDQSPPAKDAVIHTLNLNIIKVDVIR